MDFIKILAKSMHIIVWIVFWNFKIFLLLRGHIPSTFRHFSVTKVTENT